MDASKSRRQARQSHGAGRLNWNRQALICVVLSVVCTGILVTLTDLERDVRRWLRQPNAVERIGHVPRRIET